MGRLCTVRASALATLTAAVLAAPEAALTADSAGFVPQYGGDQFMLFVTRPIGARRGSSSIFGIRYERTTYVSADPTLQCCMPLRHRALVELQLGHGAAARVQFGNRVTWDLRSRRLAPTAMFNQDWSMPGHGLSASLLAAWTP